MSTITIREVQITEECIMQTVQCGCGWQCEVIEVLHNDLLYRWTKHMITNKKEFNIFCIKEHSFTSLKKYDFWPPFDIERLNKLGVLL
jgi:hypothetical protein